MKNFINVVDDVDARVENAWKKYSKYIWVVLIAIVAITYSLNEYKQSEIDGSNASAEAAYEIIKSENKIREHKDLFAKLNDLDKIIAMRNIAKNTKSKDREWLMDEVEKNIANDDYFKIEYIDMKVEMMVNAKRYKDAIKVIKSKIYLNSLDWMVMGDLSMELGNKSDSNNFYLQGIKMAKTEGVKQLILGKLGNIEELIAENK